MFLLCPEFLFQAIKLGHDIVSRDLSMTGDLGIVFFRSLIFCPAAPTTTMVAVLVLFIGMCSLTSHGPL